jgi:hypothetical protein
LISESLQKTNISLDILDMNKLAVLKGFVLKRFFRLDEKLRTHAFQLYQRRSSLFFCVDSI